MNWTDNNNETNKFEAARRPEQSIPMQELASGLSRIRAARENVEISISDVVARLAAKEYNENLDRVRKAAETEAAEAQAVQNAHEYPLVSNAEAAGPAPAALPKQPKVPQQPETDLLHEDELDPNAIRAMLNDIRDSLEEDR